MEIKIRLISLGKRQVDIVAALRERFHETISSPELSKIINGVRNDNKSHRVIDEINVILEEWENHNNERSDHQCPQNR